MIGPELYGSTILKSAFEQQEHAARGPRAARTSRSASVQLGAGLGTSVVTGLGAPRVRGVLSIEWTPIADVPRDRDHDGVMDADDMCPDVPGAADGPLGSRGCPEAPRDSDGDGIIDIEDACPDLRGIVTHQPMTHGCPDRSRRDRPLRRPTRLPIAPRGSTAPEGSPSGKRSAS